MEPNRTTSKVEQYGACAAVLGPYLAIIQIGDLRPYFYRNTGRIRSIHGVNTAKIRREYGSKSPTWITEKYGSHMAVYVQSTVKKWPFTVRLGTFTEHRKPSPEVIPSREV